MLALDADLSVTRNRRLKNRLLKVAARTTKSIIYYCTLQATLHQVTGSQLAPNQEKKKNKRKGGGEREKEGKLRAREKLYVAPFFEVATTTSR